MKINDMLDENEELRYRLKLDPKEPLDLTEFRKNKAIRQEEAKALNFQLQNEVGQSYAPFEAPFEDLIHVSL